MTPTFAHLLREWRNGRPLDQARKDLGVAWNTLRDWESGKTLPRDRDLPFLAQAMACPEGSLRDAVISDRAKRAEQVA